MKNNPWTLIVPMLVFAAGIGFAIGQWLQYPPERLPLPSHGAVTTESGRWEYFLCADDRFVGVPPRLWVNGDEVWFDRTGVRLP